MDASSLLGPALPDSRLSTCTTMLCVDMTGLKQAALPLLPQAFHMG